MHVNFYYGLCFSNYPFEEKATLYASIRHCANPARIYFSEFHTSNVDVHHLIAEINAGEQEIVH